MGSIHKLIIEDDEGKTTVVPVSRGEISIGRMEGNTIRLMERNVSRRHARLLRENGTVFIEDLNSFNGVKINGERIDKRIEIKEGDLVEIGDYHLALQAAHHDEDPGQAVARETAGPVLTQAPTVPGGAGHPSSALSQPWQGAGAPTIPEFRPPEQVLAEVRAEQQAQALRNATSSFPGPPDPMVGPPVRPSQPVLPPFPAGPPPGGGIGMPTVPGLGVMPMPKTETGLAKTEQIQVGAARLAEVPRLVCVSTEYAGRDFPLTRPEIVIGRVEDNDVVIEHRSVSRNHAKIVFDGRVHKIIDLESANGILVNGEEYAITDLRKNDLIELGHVKFRFIPAGEPFVPTDDETRAMVDAGISPPRTADVTAPPASVPSEPVPAAKPMAAMPPPISKPSPPQPQPALATQSAPAPAHREEAGQGHTVEIQVGDDPSNAATVTDTPLSALVNVPELYDPKIDPGPSGAKAAEPLLRHEGRNGASAPAAPMVRRDEATHPEVTAASRSGPRPAASQERRSGARPAAQRTGSDVEETRDNRGVIFAAVLVLVVLVVLIGGGIILRGSPANYDQELQTLIDHGDYTGAYRYYIENAAQFKDKQKAFDLASSAKSKASAPSDPVNVAPAPTPKPTEARPALAVAEPATEELPTGDEVEAVPARPAPGVPVAIKPTKAPLATPSPAAAAAAANNKKNLERAKQYEREGRRALLQGDLAKAERLLTLCLQTVEYPPCHRQLGILFASRDDTRQALKHYERYVELDPEAGDATTVRKLIKEARAGH